MLTPVELAALREATEALRVLGDAYRREEEREAARRRAHEPVMTLAEPRESVEQRKARELWPEWVRGHRLAGIELDPEVTS